ncbi:MAG: hypothetical protein QXS20_10875 [Candidatus Thorarchaeota archaeon]
MGVCLITRVKMDRQRRIRIPKRAQVKGNTFLLVTLGTYHILLPVPREKPELDIESPISELLGQTDAEITRDTADRWRRKNGGVD